MELCSLRAELRSAGVFEHRVPTIAWGPFAGVLTYTAIWSVVGICLALVFAPAHVGLPVVSDQHRDWLHQIETTRNLELPRVVSMLFIGLDYQIEHHAWARQAISPVDMREAIRATVLD